MKRPSQTVEDYLKAIYRIQVDGGQASASAKEIAHWMLVAPGTVTSMLKSLGEDGYIDYTPFKGCQLTRLGLETATGMVRRHRLLETFLVSSLGLPVAQVHQEAERLEHGLSDLVMEKLDRFLGYPDTDPMGQPIPRTGGLPLVSLAEAEVGRSYQLVRLTSDQPALVEYLSQQGLVPGVSLVLTDRQSLTLTAQVAVNQNQLVLGLALLGQILVRAQTGDG